MHRDAIVRRAIGRLASELLRRRRHRRLGFTLLGDYTRERLGISARELETAAAVARRLDELPTIAAAFERGELTWTQVRMLGAVATADTEAQWLADARGRTVRQLDAIIKAFLAGPDTPDAATTGCDGLDQRSTDARACAGRLETSVATALTTEDDDLIDGEPVVRVCIACPGRVRSLFRRALELARRMCGAPVPVWQAVEAIAAEGLSGRALDRDTDGPDAWRFAIGRHAVAGRDQHRNAVVAPHAPANETSALDELAPLPETSTLAELTRDAREFDAFALDERLRAALRVLRTLAPETGRLLWAMLDRRYCRSLGYASCDEYVRERLGMSVRKAQALVALHKHCARVPQLANAYGSGALSWVRALTILPVLDRENADSWIARTNAVTVRRLAREVEWALDWRDASGGRTGFDPPPLGAMLLGPFDGEESVTSCPRPGQNVSLACGAEATAADAVDAQTRARLSPLRIVTGGRVDWSTIACDAEIRFGAPASVVALFRWAVHASRKPGEPRWRAVERLLMAALNEWERQPAHRDPVFARDGWRCSIPVCSSRGPLQDHHIRFRSRGGDNTLGNRVAVCVAHHHYEIHRGVVRSWGTAPDAVHWELGVRDDGPPLIELIGECYLAASEPSIARVADLSACGDWSAAVIPPSPDRSGDTPRFQSRG